MSKHSQQPHICKVVLLGESGVGKTSIISQFIEHEFYEFLTSTTGAQFSTKTVTFDKYNKSIDFEIWDTAGQERFRAMSRIFYKDAAIAILVYDITREDSFNELKDYWVNELKENASKDIIIGFAANKSDLFEKEKVNENEARAFAESLGAVYEPTSAKNRNGIDELFMEVGERYLKTTGLDQDKKKTRKKIGKDNKEEDGGKKKNECC